VSANVEELLKRHASAVDAYLHRVLARLTDAPPRLVKSITYSLTAGGKRLRPTLVLECCHACGGDSDNSSALAAAGALELIHTFSLVHDDLPAMDDDDLRRGKPTNHKVFGEAMAILAGDAMMTLAFETLAIDAEANLAPALIRELASAAGPVGMIGGQTLDIEGENQNLTLEQLQRIHRMKTGALLTCACRMGALAAGATSTQFEAVTRYGRHLGLAFQIVDDLLDVTSTPQELGKHTNKDAGGGKNTYPQLLGIEGSRAEAQKQVDSAIASIASLGDLAQGLRDLARFVIARSR
jgi:geranylgeranyl diphosphate synthase type II